MSEQRPPEDRSPTPPPFWEAGLVLVGCLLLVALACWWLGLLSKPVETGHLAAVSRARGGGSGPYVGARACSECHPGEYAFFTRSGHARTLHRAARLPL